VRLVACPDCHTQYDVSSVAAERFPCRCGRSLENRPLTPVDAQVRRCASCGASVRGEDASCTYCGSAIVRGVRPGSLICPECYAANAETSRFCVACGVAFRPEAVRLEGFELACPACEGRLRPQTVAGLGVGECGGCGGLWIPGDRFEALLARVAEAGRAAGPERRAPREPRATRGKPTAQRVQYRRCPECSAFMHRQNYRHSSGVILDACHEHGTWLDADELEQLAGFVLSGGVEAAAGSLAAWRPEPSARPARAEADLARIRLQHAPGETGSLWSLLTELFD
jgi:Zn-finger nucleic acid-binding protein